MNEPVDRLRRWALAHAGSIRNGQEPLQPEATRSPTPQPVDGRAQTGWITPTRLRGHTESICSMDWTATADGRLLLATGSYDHTARIWDLDTGTTVTTVTTYGEIVHAVAWGTTTAGHPLLATSRGHDALVWDPHTGTAITTLTGHADWVSSLAWATTADGRLLLATGSGDGTARIWDPHTGTGITLTGHTDVVRFLAWGARADGLLLLATVSDDETARIWDPHTGDTITTLAANTDWVTPPAWGTATDGRPLLAVGGDDETVRVWDPHTGDTITTIVAGGHVMAVAWALGLPVGSNQRRPTRCPALTLATTNDGRVLRLHTVAVATGTGTGTGTGETSRWQSRGPVRAEALAVAAHGLLALGRHGLWPPLGLLADLIVLTAGGPADRRGAGADGTRNGEGAGNGEGARNTYGARNGEGARNTYGARNGEGARNGRGDGDEGDRDALNDRELGELAGHPVVSALRELDWPAPSRVAMAALLVAHHEHDPGYAASPKVATPALAEALSEAISPATMNGQRRLPVMDAVTVRAAADAIPRSAIDLLAILGPDVAADDPSLVLRLGTAMARLPVLDRLARRLLTGRFPEGPTAAAARLLPADAATTRAGNPLLARSGDPHRLLPTHLALPAGPRALLAAGGNLLYRRRSALPHRRPTGRMLVLDTSPPTYGPVEVVLRLVAHLVTTALLRAGSTPTLLLAERPDTPILLAQPRDLVRLWTGRTLTRPDLVALAETAAGYRQPVIVLAHYETARWAGMFARADRDVVLLTSHTPSTSEPRPTGAHHHHLAPTATAEQIQATVRTLLGDQG